MCYSPHSADDDVTLTTNAEAISLRDQEPVGLAVLRCEIQILGRFSYSTTQP